MQIVFLDSEPVILKDIDVSPLKRLGVVSLYPRTDETLIGRRLRGADIVLTHRVKIGAEDLASANAVKLIVILGGNASLVAGKAAEQKGITICRIPDYASADMAQHTLALLLSLCSNIVPHDRLIHNGAWCACSDYAWWEKPLIPLYGKTVGIIGCGHVGKAFAKLITPFGARVIGFDPQPVSDFAGELVSREQLMGEADIISFHCPANPGNFECIGEEEIRKMKDGVLLVNTAEGKLIREADVAAALAAGKIGGYGADCVSTEPMSVHTPLLKAPNCILSGHIGSSSVSARQSLINMAADTLENFLAGTPIYRVY